MPNSSDEPETEETEPETGEPETEQPAQSMEDAILAALIAGAEDWPETRVLDHLLGDWQVRTEWEPLVGRGVRVIDSRAETGWIFGGRVLESHSFDADGLETARLFIAFDRTIGDYIAFTVHSMSTFFVLERGTYDHESKMLVFEGIEPVHGGDMKIRYLRSMHLSADGEYSTVISYPDVPPGTFGPMSVTHTRIA